MSAFTNTPTTPTSRRYGLNKCASKTHIRQTWDVQLKVCATPLPPPFEGQHLRHRLYGYILRYSKLFKLTAASNAGGVQWRIQEGVGGG